LAVPTERAKMLGVVYDNLPIEGAVPVSELAAISSLDAAEAVAAVETLKAEGARIVGDENKGYYRELPPPLDPRTVTALAQGRIGSTIFTFDTVVSTMSKAREIAFGGASHGTAVLAEEQTAGRGRYGRGWASARRLGLYLSVILAKEYLPPKYSLLSLAAGVAVAEAIAVAADLVPTLKWPNDVVLRGSKVGGILAESFNEPDVLILGVGINVFQCPYDFPSRVLYPVTSLAMAGAQDIDRNALAAGVLNSLDLWLERWLADGAEPVLSAWRDRNVTLGHRVRIAGTALAGVAVGVTEDGALVVKDGSGKRRVLYSAEV
jgi:BirA family biotin operon repressor/biotin-[acetyl-CoA-carboxylase] ligase